VATQKISLLFQQINGEFKDGRVSGFSETFYVQSTLAGSLALADSLAKKRAGFLTRSANIIALRAREIGGSALLSKVAYPGMLGTDSDIPQMALNVILPSTQAGYRRNIQLRGIPDGRVAFGSYVPSQAFQGAFTQWALTLGGSVFRFQAIDKTNVRVKIFSIDATGNFVIAVGTSYNVGDQIILRNATSIGGNRVNGTYFVEQKTSDTVGKLRGWGGEVVSLKGTFSKLGYIYPPISSPGIEILDATTRKVGRPFFQFRGRQRSR